MSDIKVTPSPDVTGVPVATETIAGRDWQDIKVGFGANGVATLVEDLDTKRFPVKVEAFGASADVTATTDAGSFSFLAFFKRLLTKIPDIGQKVMASSLSVTMASNQSAIPLKGDVTTVTSSVAAAGTIPAAGSDIRGYKVTGIYVPSTFDGSQISFLVCDTLSGTYLPLYDLTNQQVIMTVAASRAYNVWGETDGWAFIKVVTVSAQAGTSTDFVLQLNSLR